MEQKQERMEGMTDDPVIQELIDLSEAFVDVRDRRMKLTEKEGVAKEKLLQKMKEVGRTEYVYEGKRIRLTTKENVKVNIISEEEKDAEIKKKVAEERALSSHGAAATS